ncbi:MAG: polysulfide reductase NrfD [Candidatus Eisenbacteria sp.]|nr:polysulfide reductase NrfD [Candidatus Eisenbacteria bacterium]
MLILKAQTKWRWIIAGYLFLAGLGAGAYITGVVAGFLGDEWAQLSKIGVALGFPCVAVGCGLLIFDLGRPLNFWRAAMRPNTSWMARGTIIISTFMVLGAIHIAFWIWPFGGLSAGARAVIGMLGIVFAFSTMVYTGILLGAARPIAFWSTALLPVLFFISAASTGVMAVILTASLMGVPHSGAITTLARADIILLILEVFAVAMYFQATHRVPEGRESARLVLRGQVAPLFWLGFALLGLVIPLALEVVGVFALHDGGAATAAIVASISGIIGGLILRQVVLSGGIHAPLRAGRFEFGLPII